MSTQSSSLIRDEIHYPDSDGKPIAENTLQFEWIMTIKGGLDATFRDDSNVFVAGDLLWYPVEGDNKTRTAPDAMVVFGRPKGYRGSYMQWREDGIPPQVVFEVLSPGNRAGEMTRKFRFYERFGVEEYYTYDPGWVEPSHNPSRVKLNGWLRAGRELREIPEMTGWVSPRLGIQFGWADGKLLILGPDGSPFATYLELVEKREDLARQAEGERQRAEGERQRAEGERQRAEGERQRAERLAAQLRALGIEPEG